MIEDQLKRTNEEAEREFKDAEKALEEENKAIAAQQSGEETKAVSNPKDLPYTAKENQQILAALGFKRYEDAGVIKYNVRVLNIKIGVTFNETNPLGKIWAYKIPEGDEDKEFLKNGDLKNYPLILKYEAIKEGKEPMPETSVTGKILEKRGKAIKVEITENGETKEIFFGQGAVKKDNDGYFLPAGFSKSGKDKEGKEHEAKMAVPRDIRLPDYLTQLEQAPAADTTKEKKELPKKPDELAKTDLQPTEYATTDKVIKQEPTEYIEAIAKYTNILAEVTEAIFAEDRIPSREKGYAVKFVYYSVIEEVNKRPELSGSEIVAIAKAILDAPIDSLEKGGDHKE